MGVAHFTRAKHFSEKVAFFAQICYHYPSFAENSSFACHQKKVLALVLAFACAFTMFAGAAFTDEADFNVNADTVDTLVALGVIDGYADGSFKPEGTVSRAEMAKMIYVLRTGNSDASAYNDDKSSFTDIGDHWGRGYIKYCQSLGIISGKSVTKFDPNGKVTAQEAAKMLLVTLGYDAQKAGLEGATWASKTNALADENGLLEDVNTSFTSACPRQYAAQLIYNAIDAPTVVFRDGAYTNTNYQDEDNKTIGEKYMGLKKTVGIMASFEKTDGKDTYEMTIDPVDTAESTEGVRAEDSFKNIASDFSDLKYQTVKVLYKEDDVVYGVFATEDNTVKPGLLANLKMDGSKVKLDGTSYSIASTNTVYVNNADTRTAIATWVTTNAEGKAATTTNDLDKGASVKLLATDGTNKISALYVTTYELTKVTYVGSDYLTTNAGKLDNDDYAYASDIAKDDYVVITNSKNADGKFPVAKADVVEGKITSVKGSTGNVDSVRIDGKWYDTATLTKNNSALTISSTVKLLLVNGYIYDVTTVTAGTEDVALVIEVGQNTSVGNKYYQARILFADGTDKVVDIEKKEGDSANTAITPYKPSDVGYAPKLATFDVSKDVYTLTFLGTSEKAGHDGYYTAASTKVDGSMQASFTGTSSISKIYFNDEATVFVQYKTDEYKVVSGATARGWDSVNAASSIALTVTKDNAQYANTAFVNLGTANVPGGSDKKYAVALAAGYTDKIDGTTYTMVSAWNGTEAVKYKYEGRLTIAKGTIFEYSVDGNGIADITKMPESGEIVDSGKVSAYDAATGDITIEDSNGTDTYTITKDTLILYVDSDAEEGAEGGSIRLANKYNGSTVDVANNNVKYYFDGNSDKELSVIVVDVNNNMKW